MVAEDVRSVIADAYAPLREAAGDISSMRRALDGMQPDPPPGTSVVEAEVAGVAGRWIAAPGSVNGIVLYLHGGGFAFGSSFGYRAFAARISEVTGSRLFVPDYALAPEYPFPDGYRDALAVYRGLLDDEGVPPEDVVIMGDSAGAGLALSALMGLRQEGDPLPAAYVGMSPLADLTRSGASHRRFDDDPVVPAPESGRGMARDYANGAPLTDWRISPLFGDFSGLPPMLVQAANCERMSDDSVRIAEKVRHAGGRVELQLFYETAHVFQMFFERLPQAAEAVRQIGVFVAENRKS